MIKEIDLSQNFSFITDAAVEIICTLGNLPDLKILNLADNQITDDSLVLLAKCNGMMKL
jgi:Leucine-rich repeat (LRR) protein